MWKFTFHILKVRRSVVSVCSSSSSVNQPWTGPGREAAPGREEGVREQQSPQPHPLWSWLSAGQARPDLLGMHMAAGTALLFSKVRRTALHRQEERMENGGMNHCSFANGKNESSMFWMQKMGQCI